MKRRRCSLGEARPGTAKVHTEDSVQAKGSEAGGGVDTQVRAWPRPDLTPEQRCFPSACSLRGGRARPRRGWRHWRCHCVPTVLLHPPSSVPRGRSYSWLPRGNKSGHSTTATLPRVEPIKAGGSPQRTPERASTQGEACNKGAECLAGASCWSSGVPAPAVSLWTPVPSDGKEGGRGAGLPSPHGQRGRAVWSLPERSGDALTKGPAQV